MQRRRKVGPVTKDGDEEISQLSLEGIGEGMGQLMKESKSNGTSSIIKGWVNGSIEHYNPIIWKLGEVGVEHLFFFIDVYRKEEIRIFAEEGDQESVAILCVFIYLLGHISGVFSENDPEMFCLDFLHFSSP